MIFISLAFASCSNMTVGFEEDSPFYDGPIIDTRADVKSEEKELSTQKKEPVTTTENVDKEDKVEKVVIEDKKVVEVKEEEIQKEENETTFSYERDDE